MGLVVSDNSAMAQPSSHSTVSLLPRVHLEAAAQGGFLVIAGIGRLWASSPAVLYWGRLDKVNSSSTFSLSSTVHLGDVSVSI
jgi:hypothetical protein